LTPLDEPPCEPWPSCSPSSINEKTEASASYQPAHQFPQFSLCVPKTSSSVLVTWTNVLRLLEPSTDDLAADTQDPTVGNTGSAAVVPWWDCVGD
jgi:hypothetical protein